MQWHVKKSLVNGSITIPASKSHTIRALLIGTLAHGVSTIKNPLTTGDGASAIQAVRALGAEVLENGNTITIKGIGNHYNIGSERVSTGNSGTSTCLFSSAAALGSLPRTFDGDASLRSRPMKPLLTALCDLGATVSYGRKNGDVPFTITGPLKGGTTRVLGKNSQYVSSLLFTCPLLPNDTVLTVDDPHEKPYIGLTLWWLDKMGIRYEASDDYSRFKLFGNQIYRSCTETIASDFSSATFAAVAAAITGSKLTLKGIDFSDPQGDKGVFDLLSTMGATVFRGDRKGIVNGAGAMKGQVLDLNAMPDSLPSFAVAACVAQGTTHIVNVAQARIKETDRITVMCSELKKMGADISETPDGLIIKHSALHSARVNGHHDHRVVMALALAGMIADGETIIDTAESADVTYPTFVKDFKAIGADISCC